MKKRIRIRFRSFVLLVCTVALIAISFLAIFPSPVGQVLEKRAEIQHAILTDENTEFVLAKDEKTGDYYAIPGEWVKTKKSVHFVVTGEAIKIDP